MISSIDEDSRLFCRSFGGLDKDLAFVLIYNIASSKVAIPKGDLSILW